MSMIRRNWSPFSEIRRLEDEINDVFRTLRSDVTEARDRIYSLDVDVIETNDEYIIKANVPGFSREDLSIEATSQHIEIRAKREDETYEEDAEMLINERMNLHMRRRIAFDKPVKPSDGNTILNHGILTITMPKMEEAKAVKLIPEEIEE